MPGSLEHMIKTVVAKDPVAQSIKRAARIDVSLGELASGEAISDGAITDAKIASLSVGKLLAGNIAVAMNITAGGTISAGNTKMSNTGIDLALLPTSSYIELLNDNDTSISSRISPSGVVAGKRGTLSFFNKTSLGERGIELLQSTNDNSEYASVFVGAVRGGTNPDDSENAYIYMARSPLGFGPGFIHIHGEVDFARVPTSAQGPTAAEDLARKGYVDSELAENTLTSPSVVAGWSIVAGFPLEIRKLKAGGIITVVGKIRNTSGASKAAGSTIWTNVIANRPGTARTFSCPRTDNAQVWLNDASVPIGVNANGDVVCRTNVGAGVELDFSGIIYTAGT